MRGDSTDEGNQLHGSELFLDSVYDGVNRLQEDGGVAPEMVHRPSEDVPPPPPNIPLRRTHSKE